MRLATGSSGSRYSQYGNHPTTLGVRDMKSRRRTGRGKRAGAKDGQTRLCIALPTSRAQLLRGYCAIHGLELGTVVDWGLDHAMGGFYFACRPPRSPADQQPDIAPDEAA
jgi:hypothetical protein